MLPYNLTSDALIWNPANVAHIARHGVTFREVQEVCEGRYIVGQGHSERFIVIGPTLARRMVAVILEASYERMYYVVTARPASRGERRIYREETE